MNSRSSCTLAALHSNTNAITLILFNVLFSMFNAEALLEINHSIQPFHCGLSMPCNTVLCKCKHSTNTKHTVKILVCANIFSLFFIHSLLYRCCFMCHTRRRRRLLSIRFTRLSRIMTVMHSTPL